MEQLTGSLTLGTMWALVRGTGEDRVCHGATDWEPPDAGYDVGSGARVWRRELASASPPPPAQLTASSSPLLNTTSDYFRHNLHQRCSVTVPTLEFDYLYILH